MPCYDKKLEASRQDFYNDIYSTRDVDCVITTGELDVLMRERGWDLSRPVPSESASSRPSPIIPELISHPGSSSGSYLSDLVSHYNKPGTQLSSRTVMRSTDYEEYTVTDNASGKVLFRGARCYGFKNLQNVVRKIGRAAGISTVRGAAGRLEGIRAKAGSDTAYDYVELMACPSGCVNGGGQLKPSAEFLAANGSVGAVDAGARWGNKEWTRRVEDAYWRTGGIPTPPPSPPSVPCALEEKTTHQSHADGLAAKVLSELCGSSPQLCWEAQMDEEGEKKRQQFFRTQYRAVESDVMGINVVW